MATMTSERHLPNLIINRVPNQATFDAMQSAGQINNDELYFVEEEGIFYSLSKTGNSIQLINLRTNQPVGNAIDIGTMQAGSVGHTLTIGTYSFDGSADVSIPIYDGTYH